MKSQRGVVWPYLVLSVALVGALVFGTYQTQQKNRLALETENKYMSAFHKLKWTSENVEERTAKLMATNDRIMQQALLSDLRVYSAQAVEHMSVLPFMTTNTPRIENFLNSLRERSDQLYEKLNRGGTLSQEDWTQLAELRKQSVFFESELSNLLGLVGGGMIRWRDTVRNTAPNQTGQTPTPITKSVIQLDQRLAPPPGEENALAPEAAGPMPRPRTDPGPPVGPGQAVAAVRRFVDMPLKADPVVTGPSDPGDKLHEFSLYFMEAVKTNGLKMNFGVSVHGGHVVYMIDGRPVTQKAFNQTQLVEKARTMLRKWGYATAEFVSAAENDGTLVMDFAPLEQGVYVQTDRVKVMLAMDNGELVGFDARNYWMNRHARQFKRPTLPKEEALKRVAPRLKVEGEPRLALIADRRSQERLTWEVRGSVDDQRFLVYLDANSGEELDVERLAGDPAAPMGEGPQR